MTTKVKSATERLAELRYNQAHNTNHCLEEILLILVHSGRTIYGVADELGVSDTTVRRYLALYNIREKVA